ncbi:transmembrane protein, putative [Medicago truncatula]|uniref:Transmembrane protein, putative n=1 Tax=Medicago truncatula TaxID=3880 RepID=A0A072U1Y8_MEDTR|nr:transmembrane protein, putative [Medicago truncatula]
MPKAPKMLGTALLLLKLASVQFFWLPWMSHERFRPVVGVNRNPPLTSNLARREVKEVVKVDGRRGQGKRKRMFHLSELSVFVFIAVMMKTTHFSSFGLDFSFQKCHQF